MSKRTRIKESVDIDNLSAIEALYLGENRKPFYFTGEYCKRGAQSEKHAVVLFKMEGRIREGYVPEDAFNSSKRISGKDLLSMIQNQEEK